jgi:predicted transglutaminase-like cysteine proteinase
MVAMPRVANQLHMICTVEYGDDILVLDNKQVQVIPSTMLRGYYIPKYGFDPYGWWRYKHV